MIRPISFSSRYTVKANVHEKNKEGKFWKFANFASGVVSKNDSCKLVVAYEEEKKQPYASKFFISLSVPDKMDYIVEKYFKHNKMFFRKSKNP